MAAVQPTIKKIFKVAFDNKKGDICRTFKNIHLFLQNASLTPNAHEKIYRMSMLFSPFNQLTSLYIPYNNHSFKFL